MATYAIGDIQGCFWTLLRLLRRVGLSPDDRLVLVGDLVNRGPRSLEVLRWAEGQGDRVNTVLGNHDLHLLACADGISSPREGDTLDEVLAAPDLPRLLAWLRSRPLTLREGSFFVVHAGLVPSWGPELAASLGREVEDALALPGGEPLRALRSPSGDTWDGELAGVARLSFIVKVLTRIRTCTADGRLGTKFSGPPDEAPKGFRPWFELREPGPETIVFGHWAALGFRKEPGFLALDSGCVWGRSLTAVRLDDLAVFHEPAAD